MDDFVKLQRVADLLDKKLRTLSVMQVEMTKSFMPQVLDSTYS